MAFNNLIFYPFLFSLDAASQSISKNIFPFRFKLFLLSGLGGLSLSGSLGLAPTPSGSLRLLRALAGLSQEMASINNLNRYIS